MVYEQIEALVSGECASAPARLPRLGSQLGCSGGRGLVERPYKQVKDQALHVGAPGHPLTWGWHALLPKPTQAIYGS